MSGPGCLRRCGCSGRRWCAVGPGCAVGGGPPARRPRRERRSARRLVARPGPAAAHGHRSLALRTLRRLHTVGACVAETCPAWPRRRPRAPQLAPVASCLLVCLTRDNAWLVNAANGTKLALRAHFGHNRAIFREQGEFCTGIAVEQQLLANVVAPGRWGVLLRDRRVEVVSI